MFLYGLSQNPSKILFAFSLAFDVVSIRDGFSINSPVLIELSGKATNVGVVSTGTVLYFGFSADYSINDRGFNASWTEVLVPNV